MTEALLPRLAKTGRRWLKEVRTRYWFCALALYVGMAIIMLREGLGDGAQLPQGTNALNAYLVFAFQAHLGVPTWFSPFTDWGQPIPSYPGLDVSSGLAAAGFVTATQYVRVTELVTIALAGLGMFWMVLRLGGNPPSAMVAGMFYSLLGETPHFFEGHVPSMVSIALAPILFGLVILYFRRPSLGQGVALAVVLYLLFSVGDLGFLYKFLFFAVPIAVFQIYRRWSSKLYSRKELQSVALSVLLLVALLSSWIVTYAGGVRPQLTTGIVTTAPPFLMTSGESLYLAFVGFGGDNSFTNFALGSPTYALGFPLTAPLFLVVPTLVGLYAVRYAPRSHTLFYLSGLLALLFSTGPTYSSIWVLNSTLYRWIPGFSADPTLFHWSVYYILVLSALTGVGLSRLESWFARSLGAPGPHARVVGTRPVSETPSHRQAVLRPRRGLYRPRSAGASARVVVAVSLSTLCLAAASPVVQNWEAFSSPPGLFVFPANYTYAFNYISAQPDEGGILAVPFGNIYERTPWGGVSASSQLVAGVGTGRNLAVFEAGTPYSLALDTVIGNGLAYGYTNNLTKLLNATDIQFVVGTRYPNWSYASDPIYSPSASYSGLENQTGLGLPTYTNQLQQVYRIPNPAGAVTAFGRYMVYQGSSSLTYEILNQPWYNGSDALICLCDVPSSAIAEVVSHAYGFIVNAPELNDLSASLWSALATGGVPLFVELDSHDFVSGTTSARVDPWQSSNGVSFETMRDGLAATALPSTLGTLAQQGYRSIDVSARAMAPPGSVAHLGTGTGSLTLVNLTPPIQNYTALPYWNLSIVSAGINNQGQYNYSGSAKLVELEGTRFVNWTFVPFNDTFQYLNFDFHNLTTSTGISLTFKGDTAQASTPILQILFNSTEATVPGYVSGVDSKTDSTTYSFAFSTATGPGAGSLADHLESISRFVIGYPATGQGRELLASNLSAFRAPAPGFHQVTFGTVSFTANATLDLYSSPAVRYDTLTLEARAGPLPQKPTPRLSYYLPLDGSDAVSVTVPFEGWFLLQIAQTYSPLWKLTGAFESATHLITEVGLNGWLVNTSTQTTFHIAYGGAALSRVGDLVEGAGLVGFVLAIAFVYSDRIRSRASQRRPSPHSKRPSSDATGASNPIDKA